MKLHFDDKKLMKILKVERRDRVGPTIWATTSDYEAYI